MQDFQSQYLQRWLSCLPGKNAAILDAGCGNGRYSFFVKSLEFNNLQAVDLFKSVEGLENYRRASIADLPFEGASFDLVFCLSVINYLEKPDVGLREFARVLKPGGVLLLSSLTKFSAYGLIRWLRQKFFPEKYPHLQGFRFCSAFEMKTALREAGFEVLEVDGWHNRWFAKLGRRLFPGTRFFENAPKSLMPNTFWANWRAIFGYHFLIVACLVGQNRNADLR